MSQVAERIKEIRSIMDVSQKLFTERLGVSRSHISKIETGAVNPSNQLIKSICREYGIREKWLREGKGRIEKKPLTYKEVKELDQGLERIAYYSAAERLRFANAVIRNAFDLIKSLKDLTTKSDNPEAIEFLKAKKRFQRTANKLQKLFPSKNR